MEEFVRILIASRDGSLPANLGLIVDSVDCTGTLSVLQQVIGISSLHRELLHSQQSFHQSETSDCLKHIYQLSKVPLQVQGLVAKGLAREGASTIVYEGRSLSIGSQEPPLGFNDSSIRRRPSQGTPLKLAKLC